MFGVHVDTLLPCGASSENSLKDVWLTRDLANQCAKLLKSIECFLYCLISVEQRNGCNFFSVLFVSWMSGQKVSNEHIFSFMEVNVKLITKQLVYQSFETIGLWFSLCFHDVDERRMININLKFHPSQVVVKSFNVDCHSMKFQFTCAVPGRCVIKTFRMISYQFQLSILPLVQGRACCYFASVGIKYKFSIRCRHG